MSIRPGSDDEAGGVDLLGPFGFVDPAVDLRHRAVFDQDVHHPVEVLARIDDAPAADQDACSCFLRVDQRAEIEDGHADRRRRW